MMSDEGQISIDFLVGISIFLLTLAFMIQFIPGLFMSVSGEGSLNSVAYRTATILAEDPGWGKITPLMERIGNSIQRKI